jgi:hypothetical protein
MKNLQNEQTITTFQANQINHAFVATPLHFAKYKKHLKMQSRVVELINFVIYKTIGFHKSQDWISNSQIQEELNLKSEQQIRNVKKAAAAHNVIKITGTNIFEFNFDFETWIDDQGVPLKTILENEATAKQKTQMKLVNSTPQKINANPPNKFDLQQKLLQKKICSSKRASANPENISLQEKQKDGLARLRKLCIPDVDQQKIIDASQALGQTHFVGLYAEKVTQGFFMLMRKGFAFDDILHHWQRQKTRFFNLSNIEQAINKANKRLKSKVTHSTQQDNAPDLQMCDNVRKLLDQYATNSAAGGK